MRRSDDLATVVVRCAWAVARRDILGEGLAGLDGTVTRVVNTLIGQKVYDLRHARLTKLLNSGVPAPQLAE